MRLAGHSFEQKGGSSSKGCYRTGTTAHVQGGPKKKGDMYVCTNNIGTECSDIIY